MKYYKVKVKCGHVRKSKYILKWIFIKAEDGKEAAEIARRKPRVKHNHKDAIREVIEIDFEKYCLGLRAMEDDAYFQVHNKQDQISLNVVKQEELIDEEVVQKLKKKSIGRRLRETAIEKEWKKMKYRGYSYYE
ncbi:MAG: hypothetical protein IAA85_00870 [Firmicutes bacterium]|nr:hypothetical protein [Candidatus Alectryobacillus merdavium]